MSAWFSNTLGIDLDSALDVVKQQANKLKEDAVQVAQAIRDKAVEANNEILEEQERVKAEADPSSGADRKISILPWETLQEDKSILSQPLMEKILELSHDDTTFKPLSPEEKASFPFKFENYVEVAMKLLRLDPNLAKMHAKMGTKGPEDEFWRSYFYRCACLRAAEGIGDTGEFGVVGAPPKVAGAAAGGGKRSQGAASSPAKAKVVGAKKEGEGGKAASPGKSPQKRQVAAASSGKQPQQQQQHKSSSAPAAPEPAETPKPAAAEEAGEEDLDLDGLEIDDVDDEGVIEGEALEELEAQIAAELGEDEP